MTFSEKSPSVTSRNFRETPYEMSHLLLAIVFKLGELVSYASETD